MFTATKDLILPSTTTGSFPRPRWFDVSMWGRPLDTCMQDVRYREKLQDAYATVISDQERSGLDILTHGDFHVDEDMAGRAWHHYPLQRWAGFEGDYLQPEETTAPWLHYPPGTLLNEIYTSWRWPHVVDKIEHRPLDYPKLWRMAQMKTRKPVKFGTCCSQVMALFLDIHTPKYTDKRQIVWDMAEAMNKELLALRDAGCRCIQIEEPTFHFMANTYGKDHEEVKFMIDAFNREVQGLDDVELWIHTCWGNPNMQRVMDDTSYANSIEIYLERCRGDVWTLEMKDRNQKDLELFAPFKNSLKKKIAIGAVSHRSLQADRPEDVAAEIRKALQYIPADKLIVSSDCGFGRQGCTREIAFYKASAIAQGCNIVRKELGFDTTYVPATNPQLQIDVVPWPQNHVKYVALLRGINVGGKNPVAMKDLVALFTTAGCRDVTTFIQSGNVIFRAPAPVLKKLPAAVSKTYGVPVVIRSHDELTAAVRANPYLAEGLDTKALHMMFLADLPTAAAVASLDPDRSPPCRFHVEGQEIYLHLPNGVAKTKITNVWIDAKLSTVSTMRNWNTILQLLELTRA